MGKTMTKAKRYLGIDVGTTAVKAAVFTASGRMVRIASCDHPLHTPRPTWVEQKPEDWIRALRKCVRQIVDGEGRNIAAIGLSSQGATLVLLDAKNKPLCRALSWLDRRSDDLVARGISGLEQHEIYLTTGWSFMGGLPLAKLVWLRRNDRALMSCVRRLAFTGDYVLRYLTGRAAIDPSSCAITQLYDLRRADWSDRLLAAAGVAREMLPEILGSAEVVGGLRPSVAVSLGLVPGTPVVTGAHDQYAAAFGADVRSAGDVMVATGTAWVLLAVSTEPAFVSDEHIKISPCATGNRWGALVAISYAGASFNWLRNACGANSFAELDASAAVCPLGADGLRFIPASTFAGARGVFANIDLSHTRAHMARAAMEGIALYAAEGLERLAAETGSVRRIVMTGGAAESRVWPQIVAECVGRTVCVHTRFEAACAGAARLAAAGIGEGGAFKPPAVKRRIRPHPRAVKEYRIVREKLKELGGALRNVP